MECTPLHVERCNQEVDNIMLPDYLNTDLQTPLYPRALPFQSQQRSPEMLRNQEEVSLTQALASSLILNRLPVPEPSTFTGDPLEYFDWKTSFMALIGQKPLPVCGKMLYLILLS